MREAPQEGLDTVQSAISYTLGANVENLTLTGTIAINGTGNGLDNVLTGNSAANALSGGQGSDLLLGEAGEDFLDGGAGNDTIEGGEGNDILVGSTDNDLLRGGMGFDTYIYHAGDGADRIEDAQGTNAILFDNRLLLGGIRPAGSTGAYTSLDGTFTYVFSGSDLIVNGVLTRNDNFQNGQFNIRLVDLPAFGDATRTSFTKLNPDPLGAPLPFFDNTSNTTTSFELQPPIGNENNLIHALGGSDYVLSGAGDDQLYREFGNDELQLERVAA